MSGLVRGGALQGFGELVEHLGGDPEPLLGGQGLAGACDPDELVSLDAVARLLEAASAELACPDFGLRLGARQRPDMLGVLAVIVLNADDVRTALRDVSRYLFVHSTAYEIVVDAPSPLMADCATLRFGVALEESSPQRQLIDGVVARTFEFAQLFVGADARLRAVSLPHTPVAAQRTYQDYFGAPVHFEQPYAGLHYDQAVLDAGLPVVDAASRESAIQQILSIHRPRAKTEADAVRHALAMTMGVVPGTRAEVARLLAVHARTLQRRLEENDTTFDAIREDVYRTSALNYLRETTIPIGQIAAAMGYSDHSAFTRACRRWFGTSPREIRRQGLP